MAFYPAIELEVGNRKARAYLQTRTSPYQPEEVDKLSRHVQELFEANRGILDHGKRYVLIVWAENKKAMIDWWVWGEDESEEEGAMIEVYLFRDTERYESPIVTAEDGLRVLAKEIED